MKSSREIYDEFVAKTNKIDPRSSDFEQQLGEAWESYQTAIGIDKDSQTSLADFVIFPVSIENHIVTPIIAKIPKNITISKLFEKFPYTDGIIKIDEQQYFLKTSRFTKHYVDQNGKLIVAPYFEYSFNDLYPACEESQLKIFNEMAKFLTRYTCSNHDEPFFKSDFYEYSNRYYYYLYKFFTYETQCLNGKAFNFEDYEIILKSVSSLDRYGIRPMQRINISNPICKPTFNDMSIISFKKLDFDFSKSDTRSCPTTVNLREPISDIGNVDVLQKTLQFIEPEDFKKYVNFFALFPKGNKYPVSILSQGYPYLMPIEYMANKELGPVDICLIMIARHASARNINRLSNIQKLSCYEDLQLKTFEDFFSDQIICKNVSTPILTSSEYTEYEDYSSYTEYKDDSSSKSPEDLKINQELLDFFVKSLTIEAPAIVSQEIFSRSFNKFTANQKKELGEFVGMVAENLARVLAIMLVMGSDQASRSLTTPLAYTALCGANIAMEQNGLTSPREFTKKSFSDLLEKFTSEQTRENFIEQYKKIPNILKLATYQFCFISAMYLASEAIKYYQEVDKEDKKSYQELMTRGMMHATASTILRAGVSIVFDKLEKYFGGRDSAQSSAPRVNPSDNVSAQLAHVSQMPNPSPESGTSETIARPVSPTLSQQV
jgi:hypothetical protein